MKNLPSVAYVGLGANLGDRPAALRFALHGLAALPRTELLQASSTYLTQPIEAEGPDYLNAVAEVSTALSPHELLDWLQRIEAHSGRERPYRNAPRTLDLDLLLYGEERIVTPSLIVPHPRLADRAFVLAPLVEIAASAVVPGHGPVTAMLPAVRWQRIERVGEPLLLPGVGLAP